MKYISERITNIGDLEQIIEKCSTISKILETELPNNKKIKTISTLLQAASDFEFHIESRKINYCE